MDDIKSSIRGYPLMFDLIIQLISVTELAWYRENIFRAP